MISRFLSLEWKQFKRSASFDKKIAIKILMGFVVLYFATAAIALGAGVYFIIKESAPQADPLVLINNFLIYYFLIDLAIRFFMQQLPFMNVKPLMLLPVKKNIIINYLLGKSMLSFFNFIPLFIFIPFSIVLLIKDYAVLNVLVWFLGVILLILSNNFVNFIINKNTKIFYILTTFLIILIGLEYFNIFKLSTYTGIALNAFYKNPLFIVGPILIFVSCYLANFRLLKKGLYLEDLDTKKAKTVNAADLSWLNRFGKMAPFLKNDIKLIWRNVRPRQVMLMSFVFLFYGLIFYTNPTYQKMPAFLAFASMFVTGGFLMTFGQQVPSWDSEYYKLMMSQNIPYKLYLEAKWYLMVVGVVIAFVLSTPYIYFGWRIYSMIVAGAFFNIGLNGFINLYGGALNTTPIKLNVKAKAFQNTNKFNPTLLLIALPKVFLPMLIFYIPYKFISFEAGTFALGLIGISGLFFKDFFIRSIEKTYQKRKYKTIAAYCETT
ncbi:MAG: hypothetical protein HQ471_08675 [Flavobacteriales bacterium]|jgi:hypothetical protein|nr:hypothetical protein [Flavobacteriales bacterium]